MAADRDLTFEISLSVLDHLGRNLYRSFATILGEAISNSWDANADNVWINIDKNQGSFSVWDDGEGMTFSDFQDKFLKIGYSKRRGGETRSSRGRPYIGRKGIGKLALLSCAESVTVISKTDKTDCVGGTINNKELDKAIADDLIPSKYRLEKPKAEELAEFAKDHVKGTMIRFEHLNEGIKHTLTYIRKIVALYFRFALLDPNFKIFINDVQVGLEDLNDLVSNTQFLWQLNDYRDPFLELFSGDEPKHKLLEPVKRVKLGKEIVGFIASVGKPRDLKIFGEDERVGIDLFVNGRVRERNILSHAPTSRVPENYLYGQIHFNGMDDEKDRFATAREGIVSDDPKFKYMLGEIDKIIGSILEDWDKWRIKHKAEGDPENRRISKVERSSRSLYNAVSEEYVGSPERTENAKVKRWVEDLTEDAHFNFQSYAECFVSENLVRKHIAEKNSPLIKEAKEEIKKYQQKEKASRKRGNVNIALRKNADVLSYLSMETLAKQVDQGKDMLTEPSLRRDANTYKPVRDALMHTALLTDEAKTLLSSTYHNIKGRVSGILNGEDEDDETKKS
jgi:hypothetical protein